MATPQPRVHNFAIVSKVICITGQLYVVKEKEAHNVFFKLNIQ